ncbi:MAG: hypothetical protein ACTSUE_08045 [Promethearchaeota archaeon]
MTPKCQTYIESYCKTQDDSNNDIETEACLEFSNHIAQCGDNGVEWGSCAELSEHNLIVNECVDNYTSVGDLNNPRSMDGKANITAECDIWIRNYGCTKDEDASLQDDPVKCKTDAVMNRKEDGNFLVIAAPFVVTNTEITENVLARSIFLIMLFLSIRVLVQHWSDRTKLFQ